MPSPFLLVEITKHPHSPVWLRTSTFYCNTVNTSAAKATGFIAPRSGRKADKHSRWGSLIAPKLSQEKQPFVGDAPLACHANSLCSTTKAEYLEPKHQEGSAGAPENIPGLVLNTVWGTELLPPQPWCLAEGSQLAAGWSPALLGSHPAMCLGTASWTGYLPRFCLFGNRDGEESQWPWERLFQCCTWARLRAAPLWLTQSVSSPCFTQIPPF